ncbi:MAG: alpha/beta hydrolase [Bacteroidota bacterium]
MKKLVKTNRGTFSVSTYGDEQNPPLMLVHGWPQTSYCWHHATPFLSDFYVIAPDLRGMGDSNRSLDINAYTKDEMAKDLFAVADELSINQFFLGGHDWGGAIVQEMAFLHPERIKKLVILNMVIINNPVGQAKVKEIMIEQMFRSSWYQFLQSINDFPEALLAGKEDVWVRFFSRGITNPIPEEAIQEYIRCYKIPHSSTTAANLYRQIPNDRKRWAKQYLGQTMEVPTCIIHGTLDPVIIKEYLEGVEEYFADLEVHRIKAGHFVVDEQPEKVGKAIAAYFLK